MANVSQDIPEAEPFSNAGTVWRCGDPFKYPLPKQPGNGWETLLGPLMEKDTAQCQVWTEEVQNLLIFAGLFSSVLSAFVVQSYQTLQPGPNEAIVTLLTHIAARLDDPTNNSSLISHPAIPFQPSPSAVRINIFWFISLVFSLTTVLIGIVSLQWLREHQQYSSNLAPKEKFAMFHMRAEGLERWYVPQIFSALPLFFQVAVSLFLIGLVDFILSFGPWVAIPVIVSIGLPLIFLILTTTLPALQAFAFCLPLGNKVPVQCPYKSPQSRLFRRFLSASELAFHICAILASQVHLILVAFPLRSIRRFRSAESKTRQTVEKEDRIWISLLISKAWNNPGWEKFDGQWLDLRDAYAKGIFHGTHRVLWKHIRNESRRIYSYDTIKGLHSIVVNDYDHELPALLTQCAQELSASVLDLSNEVKLNHVRRDRENGYLQNLLAARPLNLPIITLSSLILDPSSTILHEENCLLALKNGRTYVFSKSGNQFRHFCELIIRRWNILYPSQPLILPDILDKTLLTDTYTWIFRIMRPAGLEMDADTSNQFDLIFKSIFEVVANPEIEENDLLRSYHAHHDTATLISSASPRQSEEQVKFIRNLISTKLDGGRNGSRGRKEDLLFYYAAVYARSILNERHNDDGYQCPRAAHDIPPILTRYLQERGKPDAALGNKLHIPNISDRWWWNFLDIPDAQFVSQAQGTNEISPYQSQTNDPDKNTPSELRLSLKGDSIV